MDSTGTGYVKGPCLQDFILFSNYLIPAIQTTYTSVNNYFWPQKPSGIENVGKYFGFIFSVQGSTCYLNSILQCVRPFIEPLLQAETYRFENKELILRLYKVYQGDSPDTFVDVLEERLGYKLRRKRDAGVLT